MKIVVTAIVPALLLLVPSLQVAAQSLELPVPGLVLKDADGKLMAQVVGLTGYGSAFDPQVVFAFNGVPVGFVVDSTGVFESNKVLYFAASDCIGTPYMVNTESDWGLEEWTGGFDYVIIGPNRSNGTYRVFREATKDWEVFAPLSSYDSRGSCVNDIYNGRGLHRAEEVIPNPLEGFHGPTTANPERVLTIEGGTRLP